MIFLVFFKLLIGHALCDFPLQGDFLARGKNHKNPLPSVPWYWCLGAHALLQAGAVFYVTGSLVLALAELFLHASIDMWKSNGKINFDTDQCLHILCKVAWCAVLLIGGPIL